MAQDLHETNSASVSVDRMAQLLRQHQQEMRNYARRQIPVQFQGILDADDLVQDVYLECFRRVFEIASRSDDEIRRWLLTVLRHRIINTMEGLRAQKRGGLAHRVYASDDSIIGLLEQLCVHERTPSRSAMGHELAAKIQTELAALVPHYSQVLRLRYFDGKSFAEIAAEMGRSEGAIQMLCSRALASLRQALINTLTHA